MKNKEEDFLQFHQPLEIVEEYYQSQIKRKKLLNNEKKLSKIYDEYNEVLNRIKSLAFNKEAWLCYPSCDAEICAIKEGSPKMTEKKIIGEHIIEGAWITSSLKSYLENKDKVKKEQIEEFKESLKKIKLIMTIYFAVLLEKTSLDIFIMIKDIFFNCKISRFKYSHY